MSYYALNDYVSDGEQLTYAITWRGAKPATSELPYLSRNHIKVYEMQVQEDDTLHTIGSISDFSFLDAFTIVLTQPVTAGHYIRVVRETPSDYNVTRYASTLVRAGDFENTQRQLLFIAQELSDRAGLTRLPTATVISLVKGWAYAEAFSVTSATRNANNVIITANLVWPDGAHGVFTTVTINTAFNTIDAWTATYVKGNLNLLVTQPLVTRNAEGAVTSQPEIIIT